jgi:multisubunit Na+/H+ antiporter MnhB subunit
MLELYALLIFMLLGALIAVENHDLLSSVIAVGTVGFGLCIVFLYLGAPDLALTQLVVEILALVILIRSTVALTVPETYKGREFLAYLMTGIFILTLLFFSSRALSSLPSFGAPLMKVSKEYIALGTSRTGAPNLVAAIMFDYRALDSLGAAAVLLVSILGVITILRLKGRK